MKEQKIGYFLFFKISCYYKAVLSYAEKLTNQQLILTYFNVNLNKSLRI